MFSLFTNPRKASCHAVNGETNWLLNSKEKLAKEGLPRTNYPPLYNVKIHNMILKEGNIPTK